MRVVLQRVTEAKVTLEEKVIAEIGRGILLLVGIREGDTAQDVEFVAQKCLNLRVFEDEQAKMNLSVLDVGGEVLAVSQFTLYGDTRKGRRPSFTEAASPQKAQLLYQQFVETLRKSGLVVKSGAFGEHMLVDIHNDGPVTLIVESRG